MKIRLNFSQRILAFLFKLPHQSYVSKIIKTVLKELQTTFVQQNVGFQHMSRDELMEKHMRPSYRRVLGLPDSAALLSFDATYLFGQKSTVHKVQRQMFCNYKKRNCVKPMMVVTSTCYILAAEGLYYSDYGNNDSNIMKDMLSKDNNMMSILEPGDAVLVDRGFQTAQEDVESRGLKFFMPSLLAKKQQQFSSKEANLSRRVTILRYIVELANGRLKNKFRFLDEVISASYFPILNEILLLSCALLNKCTTKLVEDTDFHEKIYEAIDRRLDKPNLLQQKVDEGRWDTRRVIWEEANEDSVLGFSAISLSELKEITLGEYQIKMGNNYNEEHLTPDDSYKFSVHKEQDGIIRVLFRSRYSSRLTRSAWIEYAEHVNGPEGVLEWYCKCPIGARTVGCCSHIAAVLRYLGHDRFLERKKKKEVSSCFLDAAANLASLVGDSESESEFEEGDEEEEEELLDV